MRSESVKQANLPSPCEALCKSFVSFDNHNMAKWVKTHLRCLFVDGHKPVFLVFRFWLLAVYINSMVEVWRLQSSLKNGKGGGLATDHTNTDHHHSRTQQNKQNKPFQDMQNKFLFLVLGGLASRFHMPFSTCFLGVSLGALLKGLWGIFNYF